METMRRSMTLVVAGVVSYTGQAVVGSFHTFILVDSASSYQCISLIANFLWVLRLVGFALCYDT